MGFQPPGLWLLPQPFGNVEVGRVGRQVKEKQFLSLPVLQLLLHLSGCMYPGVVQRYRRRFSYPQREPVQLFHDGISGDALLAGSIYDSVVPTDEHQAGKAFAFGGLDTDLLIFKLPADLRSSRAPTGNADERRADCRNDSPAPTPLVRPNLTLLSVSFP